MIDMSHRRHFGALTVAAVLAAACSDNAGSSRPGRPGAIGSTPDLRPWAVGPSVEAELEAISGDDVFLSRVWDIGVDSRGRVHLIDVAEKA